MADWFASLAQQAFKLADDLADTLVQQANEAQQQLQDEQKKLQEEVHQEQERLYSSHLLPWETNIESRQILSQDLMEKVLALSIHEGNFTSSSPNKSEVQFFFQDFVPIAMRLLQIDSNLARMHAKLAPKMDEEIFWLNYYCRIVYLRACSGIDGLDAQNAVNKWKESDILRIDAPKVVATTSSLSHQNTTNPSVASTTTATHGHSSVRSNPSPVQPKFVTPVKSSDKSSNSSLIDDSFDSININTPSKILSPIAPSTGDKTNSAVKKITAEETDDLDLDDLDLELEENLKDLDMLDELDDIDPSDYENIGSSEYNDELEAQIAKELGEDL